MMEIHLSPDRLLWKDVSCSGSSMIDRADQADERVWLVQHKLSSSRSRRRWYLGAQERDGGSSWDRSCMTISTQISGYFQIVPGCSHRGGRAEDRVIDQEPEKNIPWPSRRSGSCQRS